MGRFQTLEEMVLATAEAVRPPERLTVAEAAEKYRYVNNPGSYVGPYKNATTPYLVQPMEVLTSLDHTGMIFVGPAQCGKALALDTPIATPTGWTTMGDLKVGNEVFGADGKPTRVVAATDAMRDHECFRVSFDTGEQIVADADHKWMVWSTRGARYKVVTTREIFEYGTRVSYKPEVFEFRVDTTKPLECGHTDLPVDPYVFGVWLGDGITTRGAVSAHAKDVPHLVRRFEEAGYDAEASPDKRDCYTVRSRRLHRELRAAGFAFRQEKGQITTSKKHIPGCFLRASVPQRRELLRGLMDTDGHVCTGERRVSFNQKDSVLFQQVAELARTLGFKPCAHQLNQQLGDKVFPINRMTFGCADMAEVFSLPRKTESPGLARAATTGFTRRAVVAVEPVPSVPVRCIAVDAYDHLFLAGEGMIPTHNTDMGLNWLTHTAVCDPADFMMIEKSQAAARDFHQRRVDKLFRDTESVRERLRPGKHNHSTYSSKFLSGMLFTMSWPTVNELSGKPIGRLWLADYDRVDDDIGGEGSAYDLAVQRMKSFGRRGMCAAESSPSRTIENPRWIAKTPHEAPPTTGILALYNRGDRRRWYWPCLSCGHIFEPDFSLFWWPDSEDLLESAEQVVMRCPHCSHEYRDGYHEPTNTPGKRGMNQRGFWLRDNEKYDPETGAFGGEPVRSRTASFWLKGPAAAFADWSDMTLKYLKAVAEFEATGSEEALKTTVNTDQGLPFLPSGIEAERLPEELKARASEKLGEKVVPEDVRFLIATVDTQKRRFVVQVHGIRPHGDLVVIDRFNIRKSERRDEDDERYPLDPGSYVEDWHLLVEKVLLTTYDLNDDSGRFMQVRMMAVDSGGSEGVTANAYEFWRQLRADGRNLHRRVQLLKGIHSASAPMVRIDYPNAERKDRKAAARGEVPVMLVQTDQAKDLVNNMLGRTDPGGGMIHFPAWLPDWWYVEVTAETRTAKGWVNPGNQRNESFDLLVYCMALCHSSKVKMPLIDWSEPPSWAAEWDENDMVGQDDTFRFAIPPKGDYDLKALAEKLG